MSKTTVKEIDSNQDIVVGLGDYVCFKSDVEQGGQITDITDGLLTLRSEHGFEGHYIGGSHVTTERASDCWVE